jgi:hypothetical protein
MGMREECKHFQSRTYSSGETARFCVLGLAPDQPWSCPEDCPTYERRLADVGWSHGSLVDQPVELVPDGLPASERREVLESAAAIVEAVAPEMFAERRAEVELQERRDKRGWKFWRR